MHFKVIIRTNYHWTMIVVKGCLWSISCQSGAWSPGHLLCWISAGWWSLDNLQAEPPMKSQALEIIDLFVSKPFRSCLIFPLSCISCHWFLPLSCRVCLFISRPKSFLEQDGPYIYIYIYIHMYTCLYMFICTPIYTHTYSQAYMFECINRWTNVIFTFMRKIMKNIH